jgi:hypothetical protein
MSAQSRIVQLESLLYQSDSLTGKGPFPGYSTVPTAAGGIEPFDGKPLQTADFPLIASRSILQPSAQTLSLEQPPFNSDRYEPHQLITKISPDVARNESNRLPPPRYLTTSANSSINYVPYPPYVVAKNAVETWFLANAISYPFLDKEEFMRDMDELYNRYGPDSDRGPSGSVPWAAKVSGIWPTQDLTISTEKDEATLISGKQFMLFMVLAMGTTNKERMGEVERGSSKIFKARAMRDLSAAVGHEDLVSENIKMMVIFELIREAMCPIAYHSWLLRHV